MEKQDQEVLQRPARTDRRRPVSIAKITPPKGSGILPRARLFHRLDANGAYPLTWVCAPAGAGKTSLLTSYLSRKRTPYVWYRVDEGDADIATFFYYMGLAARKAAPRKRRVLPLFTPEYAQGVHAFTLRYFERFYALFKAPFIIVLDNYHLVPGQSKLHEVIVETLECLPEGQRMIIVGRQDPPAPFARTRVSNGIGFLEADEMLFTREEMESIFRQKGLDWLSPETLDQLHKKTRGWAAGIVLIAESARRKGTDSQAIPNLTTPEIFDYIAAEIFAKTEPASRQFYLRTAFMPGITSTLAEHLTGEIQAGELLANMYRSHFFVEKDTSGNPVYRYHPLFREFLLARARETFTREEIAGLQRRGAALLLEQGQVDDAAALLIDANDWDGFIPFLLGQAPTLMAQGRTQTLAGWLGVIPEEMFTQIPWLLYWKGMINLSCAPHSSRPFFELAFEGFMAGQDLIGSLMAAAGVVNAMAFEFEDFTPMDHWFSVLNSLANKLGTFPDHASEAWVVASVMTALALRESVHPEAETWARRVLAIEETPATIVPKTHALYHLYWYYAMKSGLAEIEQALAELRRLSHARESHPLATTTMHLVEAMYYEENGRHAECQAAVSACLAVAERTGVHIMDPSALMQAISSYINSNDWAGARSWIEKLRPTIETAPPFLRTAFYLFGARMAYVRDNLTEALQQSEMAVNLGSRVGSPYVSGLCHLVLAQTLHKVGREVEALEHLAQAHKVADEYQNLRLALYAYKYGAHLYYDRGEEDKATLSLRAWLSLGRRLKYRCFLDDPTVTLWLCEKALEAGIEVEYVQDIIRSRGVTVDQPPLHIEAWPWPVKVFTLGRFAVEIDGEPLAFTGKTQRKPLALLKVLIALGSREVREEQIADILWPDADGDMAYSSLHVTLNRLRKLIGHAEAVVLKDGRLSLDPRLCWVDVDAFGWILSQAEAADASRDDGRAAGFMQKSVALYRGSFLANEPEETWFDAYAERLRSRFLKAVGWLARHYEQAQAWAQAAQCYEQCLEIDDGVEEVYRNLMLCYRRLGRYGEAVAVYRRCAKTLESTFHATPSPATVNAYAALLADKRDRPVKPKRTPKTI